MKFDAVIIANFGGPRDVDEVEGFLKTLLCDQDVVRTGFPQIFHDLLFKKIAKKRSKKVKEDYKEIGGKSPIYDDTERLKTILEQTLQVPVFTFHRYLESTHKEFIKAISELDRENILVFPMFPQFSYATTGSCARFFESFLCGRTLEKLVWIPSYASHPAFIRAYQKNIQDKLRALDLSEKDVCLFYSCHGVPKKFVCFNDPYQKHCEMSFDAIKKLFPESDHVLAYQSKFGKGEWLRPYTSDLVETDLSWLQKKHVLFVPLSFTSDHIETLQEIEKEYLEPLKHLGISAHRVDAIHNDYFWVNEIIESATSFVSTQMLVRHERVKCCSKSHDCCRCKKKKLQKDLLESHVQNNCCNGTCR